MELDNTMNKTRFLSEIQKCETREGYDKLLSYLLEPKHSMFTAPSSTRFHLSVPGGLALHSLNVLDALRSVLTRNDDGTYSYTVAKQTIPISTKESGKEILHISEESLIVMALLHDICKTDFYVAVEKNRKVNGRWEQYTGYEIDDRHPLGHGEKSVMMLDSLGFKLESFERYAIRWHMGFPEGSDKYTFGQAVDLYPIIWAMHTADMMASHFMEDTENNKPLFQATRFSDNSLE